MPRPPRAAPAVREMPAAIYSPFADRLRTRAGPIHPLHVGDTRMEPFEGGRMQDLAVEAHPGLHGYCDARGVPEQVAEAVRRVATRSR